MKRKAILIAAAVVIVVCLLRTAPSVQAGPFVYVTNPLSGNVSQYDAAGDGALVPLSPPTVSTVNPPKGVAVSPDGKSAYVTTSELYGTPAIEAAVLQYSIGTGGSLTLQSSAAMPPNADPGDLKVSPDGRSLYVLNTAGISSVIQYSVQADGSLTLKSPPTVPVGLIPGRLAISPDGQNVYVPNSVSGESLVSQYSVAADGTLSPKSPPTVATGDEPVGVAVSPDGQSVYVANAVALFILDGTVSQYSVGPDGALSPKSPATVLAARHPFDVAVGLDGQSVYVTDATGGRVLQYTAGADGALTPKSPATVGAGRSPLGIAIHPDGRSVYAANASDNTISQYSVAADGTLSPNSPATVAAGSNPLEIAVTPLPRVPTSKEQCKNGGWRNFPQFKNQGQCIAFVNRGP
jgi:6-phosphogluconolactonase